MTSRDRFHSPQMPSKKWKRESGIGASPTTVSPTPCTGSNVPLARKALRCGASNAATCCWKPYEVK